MLFTLSVYQVCSLGRFDPLESLEWLSNRAMKLKKRRLRSVCWTLLTGVMRSTFAKSGKCLHKVCTWDSEIQKRPETTRLRTNKNILTTAKFNLSAKVALYLFWFNECWKWFTCLQMRSDFVQICSWRITHWSDNLNWLQETLDSLQIVVFCDLTKLELSSRDSILQIQSMLCRRQWDLCLVHRTPPLCNFWRKFSCVIRKWARHWLFARLHGSACIWHDFIQENIWIQTQNNCHHRSRTLLGSSKLQLRW